MKGKLAARNNDLLLRRYHSVGGATGFAVLVL
jgi:hypothetical protein